jgi:aspartate dehydrogenase
MQMENGSKPNIVAIGGLGAIGRVLAAKLDQGLPGLRLGAVSGRDLDKAQRFVETLSHPVPVVPLADLAAIGDIVVECAPAAVFLDVAEPAVMAGRKLVISSVGALLTAEHLVDLAAAHHAQIIVPTGALIGLDAVTAAAEGRIRSVRMVTRKPIAGLVGAPFITENGIRIEDLIEPLLIFTGTAREAAKGFPANLNVAVALALAGIGPDKTTLEIWADPGVTRNTHTIKVDADSAAFTMTIENIPSHNPRTGMITALSLISLLRKMHSPMRVGT